MPMDDVEKKTLPRRSMVVFIAATTGQGEVPDSMKSFWRFLLRKSLAAGVLSNMKCAVFGLGDSSYVKFNSAAKMLAKRLKTLGASSVVEMGLGDEMHPRGIDGAFLPWVKGLFERLDTLFPMPEGKEIDPIDQLPPPKYQVEEVTGVEATGVGANPFLTRLSATEGIAPSPLHPFRATIVANQLLTPEGHEREVRHFSFNTANSGMQYAPGDILCIMPVNLDETVDNFFLHSGLNPKMIVKIRNSNAKLSSAAEMFGDSISLRDLAKYFLDLNGMPRRGYFEMMAKFSKTEMERDRCLLFASPEGEEDYEAYARRERRAYWETLQDLPASVPSLQYLIEMIPVMKPREYSISSAPSVHGDEIHITVASVQYVTRTKRERYGTATTWLSSLSPGDSVPVWVKKGSLNLAKAMSSPIVIVSPGTGLAPFRSFLLERREKIARGEAEKAPAMLFFGCRWEKVDYLYRDELEGLLEDGTLSGLSVAFSRDNPDGKKEYVQDKIKEVKSDVAQTLLQDGSFFALAGSSGRMPRDVRAAVEEAVDESGREGKAFIADLIRHNRYLLETWS